MRRRKLVTQTIENTRLRAEIRAALIGICAQSRRDVCYFQPNFSLRVFACVSGSLPDFEPAFAEPPRTIQRWETFSRESLLLWLERISEGVVLPFEPIPPLEMLAREA